MISWGSVSSKTVAKIRKALFRILKKVRRKIAKRKARKKSKTSALKPTQAFLGDIKEKFRDYAVAIKQMQMPALKKPKALPKSLTNAISKITAKTSSKTPAKTPTKAVPKKEYIYPTLKSTYMKTLIEVRCKKFNPTRVMCFDHCGGRYYNYLWENRGTGGACKTSVILIT